MEDRDKWWIYSDPEREEIFIKYADDSEALSKALGEYYENLSTLPLPDMKRVRIYCTDSSHDEKVLLHSLIVQYVRGRANPPRIRHEEFDVKGDSLVTSLIRNSIPVDDREREKSQYFDPKYIHRLTKKSQRHLEKSGQWREKIALNCECGDNIPFRTVEGFLECLRLVLEAKTYDTSLTSIRMDFLPTKET